MEELLKVGVLSQTHGVHGEMKVYPTTDDPKRFKKLKSVLLDTGNGYKEMNISAVRFFKQYVIVKFEGYDSINDIEKYKGMGIFVTRENAVKLDEDEYFIADLIGLTVVDEDDVKIGTLNDVMITGANDVYVIERINGEELLLPAIKQCILKVDVLNGYIKVRLLKGL